MQTQLEHLPVLKIFVVIVDWTALNRGLRDEVEDN